jgi:hypothetical protein
MTAAEVFHARMILTSGKRDGFYEKFVTLLIGGTKIAPTIPCSDSRKKPAPACAAEQGKMFCEPGVI